MMKTWNLIDAQDHLEEIVLSALEHRPQRVELGLGQGAVVVVSGEDYARMTEARELDRESDRTRVAAHSVDPRP